MKPCSRKTRGKSQFCEDCTGLEWEAIANILSVTISQIAGIIATNTTIRRDGLKTQVFAPTGVARGSNRSTFTKKPVALVVLPARSLHRSNPLYLETNSGQLPIIMVGGIFTAEDAWEKITAGASLVQVYTGWIYEGPLMVRRILEGLLQSWRSRIGIHL